MPFLDIEDVGTTKRKAMSPTRRLRIWERHRGACCLCGAKIDGVREGWIIEHIRALELGGEDTDENCGPAHATCADAKTHGKAGDHAVAAKAKRAKRAHLGLKQSKTPMSCGRRSRWKKKMDGSIVRREA